MNYFKSRVLLALAYARLGRNIFVNTVMRYSKAIGIARRRISSVNCARGECIVALAVFPFYSPTPFASAMNDA